MSSENVAENSRFWRCGGRRSRILRMSRMKPMSSIRSASSRTRTSTCDRSIVRWPAWSSRRPGVATTIAGPARRARTCGLEADAAVDRGRADAAMGAVGADALLDLEGELAGRGQDEDADRRPGRVARGRVRCAPRPTAMAVVRAAGGSAGRTRPSCRCRSGRRRAGRGRRGRAGSPRPGPGWARCSPGPRRRGGARARARGYRRTWEASAPEGPPATFAGPGQGDDVDRDQRCGTGALTGAPIEHETRLYSTQRSGVERHARRLLGSACPCRAFGRAAARALEQRPRATARASRSSSAGLKAWRRTRPCIARASERRASGGRRIADDRLRVALGERRRDPQRVVVLGREAGRPRQVGAKAARGEARRRPPRRRAGPAGRAASPGGARGPRTTAAVFGP